MGKPIIVFQSDWTYAEGAVAATYGVIKSVDRDIEIIDGTHQIPQYDIYSASYRLYQYMPFWPVGTIFVSVVDPSVGTSRKGCVAKTSNGYYVVTPDNGTLTYVKKYFGIDEVREIDESINRLRGKGTDDVAVFHGRDLFGYCAARLASGIIDYQQVGPTYPVDEIKCFTLANAKLNNNSVEGFFEVGDPNFGNLWSNIGCDYFDKLDIKYGDQVKTTIYYQGKEVFKQTIPYFKSFSYAVAGSVMIYRNEVNKVSVAKVVGNLMKDYNLYFGADYTVKFEKQ